MQVLYPIVSNCVKMRLKKDGKWIFEDKEAFEEWKEDISISSRLAIFTSKARTLFVYKYRSNSWYFLSSIFYTRELCEVVRELKETSQLFKSFL